MNFFKGAEIVLDNENSTVITRQSDGTASLSFSVTARVNSLVCT